MMLVVPYGELIAYEKGYRFIRKLEVYFFQLSRFILGSYFVKHRVSATLDFNCEQEFSRVSHLGRSLVHMSLTGPRTPTPH